MNSIFITGSSGFVGRNIVKELSPTYIFNNYLKNNFIDIKQDVVLHLAGKAHDFKNVVNPLEYYSVNTDLSKKVFDKFIFSCASVFITLSSVKASSDSIDHLLTEDHISNPITHYGKSKLLAEEYILSKKIPAGKRVYILRPCMIHGPGNKGNLNLLYKIVSKGLPWPLGAFDNKRSFCNIGNLCFVIKELIQNDQIPSGVYNVSDDEPLSTNEIVKIIAESQKKNFLVVNAPKFLVRFISKLGDVFRLPLNSERLGKLTENYIVSNHKIKNAIKKPLPLTAKEGLLITINSFKNVH